MLRRIRSGVVWACTLSLAACGGPAAPPAPGPPSYQYTCCLKSDIERDWQPGQTLTLHWIARLEPAASMPKNHLEVLSVQLEGPYPDVGALKQGGKATGILSASSRSLASQPAAEAAWSSAAQYASRIRGGGPDAWAASRSRSAAGARCS